MTLTTTLINPVNGTKEELLIGTAKPVDEFIMVETKDYTKMLLPKEFDDFIKDKGFKIA